MKALLITWTIALAGCATADFNYLPKTTNISEPSLDSVNQSFVGDSMLRQGKYSEHEAILVENKVDIGISYDIYPGIFLKKGENQTTETFLPTGNEDSGIIKKSALSDPWKALIAYKNTNKLCVLTAYNITRCKENADFNRIKKPSISKDSFQQTLIYSGKIKEKINISYREFSNNLARPAFNNEVEYDLSESKIIGYKGAKIEVIEATNQYIKYRVLSNFNKANF